MRASALRLAASLSVAGAACLAAPAHAAVEDFVMGLGASGTAPFDAAAGAGLDASAGDAIVRTNDRVMYRVGYALRPADSDNLISLELGDTATPGHYDGPPNPQIAYFDLRDLPAGTQGCENVQSTPVSNPPPPKTSGITADGKRLFCYQAGPINGSNLEFMYRVSGHAPNGATIGPMKVSYQSASNAATTAPTILNNPAHATTPTFGNPTLTVSAAPRWQVQKHPTTSVFLPGSGPAGEDGYVAAFNIGVYALGSRKGLEALKPNFTIAENFNDPDMPGARLVDWDMTVPGFVRANLGSGAGGQHGCGDWNSQFTRLGNSFDNIYYQPNDTGAPSTKPNTVAYGGDCRATAVDNAAKTATLTLTGTDFSLTHYPVQRGGSGTLVNTSNLEDPTNQWWVASKSVLVWVPVNDLTPGVHEDLRNQVTLQGSSVTGQPNPPAHADATARFTRVEDGVFSKVYGLSGRWRQGTAGLDMAICDPSLGGDCLVNQAAPGQILESRILAYNRGTQDFGPGYICDRIDNTRTRFADLRATTPSGTSHTVDPKTGILLYPLAGRLNVSWQLGVGGTGISGGTWRSYTTTANEYANPSTTGSAQADSACGDADATWFDSVDALQAAGHSLADVTRVRGRYDSFGRAVSVLAYIPLQVNAQHAFAGSDLAPGSAFAQGASTHDAIAPNQAHWQHTAGAVIGRGADALRIRETQFVGISKSAESPHHIDGGEVMRGETVIYKLTVNLSSSSNDHRADSVDVWDVLPPHLGYVSGSSTLGSTTLPDPTCEAPGVTPAAGPFQANAVPAGHTVCRWTLRDQPVKKVPDIGDASANLPPLHYRAVVDVNAPVGTQLLNSSFADTSRNLRRDAVYQDARGFVCLPNERCSFSNWKLRVNANTGIVLDKRVSSPLVPQDTGFTYTLYYAAIGTPLEQLRILDVLPSPEDGRSSAYTGTLQLAGPIAAPVTGNGPPALTADPALIVLYTSNATAHIKRDPYHASHVVNGTGHNSDTSTNWCTPAQFGTPHCPASASAATAFMALPYGPNGTMPMNTAYQLTVPVLASGNADGNTYLNHFVADSPTLLARRPGTRTVLTTVQASLPQANTTIVSGRVYEEKSQPANTSDDGHGTDTGIGGVHVSLACTGPDFNAATTTATDGSYHFTGVPRGAQCTLTETQPAGYDNAYNSPGTGGTGQTGDTGTGNSTIRLTVPASGISSGNNFAEISHAAGVSVSGRVYEEKSQPANTSDDGHGTDTGINGVQVSLACTGPDFNATTTTGADGSYRFTGVPRGAQCTLTETQPAGFSNAYNRPGTGGTGQTGDTGTGNSTIRLTVPAGDSTGNNFAETRSRPGSPVAVPTLGWPMLAALSALLAGIGGWRRQRRAV